MPELPEVEAARRAIEENCVGKRIAKAIVADDSKVIDGVSASEFEASLAGKTIFSGHRKGKNLWLRLDSPPFPSFQFGMTGAVYIKGVAVTQYKWSAVKDGDEWPSKYSKVFMELDDGVEFSFTDKRRFAKVRLLEDPTSVPPISELGPDALLQPMSADEFVASLNKKKIAIKTLLLDQSYISGIGNWIADEVLYQAKIHPLQVASSLSKESCLTLQICIKEVIEKAVEVGADNSQYPNNWIFHNREKKPGKAFVDGKKIEFITAGGRTTAFVPDLQKLSGDQAAKAPNKQKKQSSRGKGHRGDSDEDESIEPVSDEHDDTVNTKSKKKTNRGDQVKKKLPAKRKTKESEDEDNSDSESDAAITKRKKVTEAKVQLKRKVPARRKSKESESEDNDDGTDEDDIAEKPKSQAKKKLPTKGKSKESNDDTDDNDDENQMKRSKIAADSKQSKVEKTTKKTTQSGQNGKNLRKKAK